MSSENKDYPNEIAADVLRVLSEMKFFELLDVQLCPLDNSLNPAQCTHTFDRSVEILRANKLNADDVADVLAVLRSKGACCDCEVL